MIIHLSSNNPWRATYTTESGQVLYKCDATSPLTLSTREFTLYRTLAPSELGWTEPSTESATTHDVPFGILTAINRGNPFREDDAKPSVQKDERDDADFYLRDQFKPVGQIIYNVWMSTSSKIKVFNDVSEVEGRSAGSFFRKSGFGMYGRNQTFTASDGNEYTWKLGFTSCSLYPIATPAVKRPTPILTFSHRSLGIFSKSHPAMLEVKNGFEGMLDIFLLTFIYVERVRRDREDRGRRRGGGP